MLRFSDQAQVSNFMKEGKKHSILATNFYSISNMARQVSKLKGRYCTLNTFLSNGSVRSAACAAGGAVSEST